jgi:hypothetical protein
MPRYSWLDLFSDYPVPPQLTLEQLRRNIVTIDERLQNLWNLGENVFLGWASSPSGMLLLSLQHYLLAEYVSGARQIVGEERPAQFIARQISGPREMSAESLEALAGKLGLQAQALAMPFEPEEGIGRELMSALVQRYSLSYTEDRPVLLLDIVGFARFPAMEQVVLLQSLSHSVNSAYAKLASRNVSINFARSTTGDGFYIWNRAHTLEASADLYRLMLLILADNAVAQRKARSRTVPRLRCAFHVGPHYEFYQSDGLNPTRISYLVGEVTITLARLLEAAMPGQILLGEFQANVEQQNGASLRLGTVEFVERMRAAVWDLTGVRLAGEAVREIKSYLTGPRSADGRYRVTRYVAADKHGFRHVMFNAKINIHRETGDPILLGAREQDLKGFEIDPGAD